MTPSLSITRPKILTNTQASSVLSLAALCCQNDCISLSYPVSPEDNAIHYLLTDQKGQLLSALAGSALPSLIPNTGNADISPAFFPWL